MIAQLNKDYIRTRPWKVVPRLISYLLFEGRPLTTKGQWINPYVFILLNALKQAPFRDKVKQPIFITGTGRSGSTILGVLLSLHPDVGFLNEPKALWHSLLPYEDVIGSYSRGQAAFRLTDQDADEQVQKAANALYKAYLILSGSKRVVDKYPELIFRVPFLLSLFPDAKIIFLTRNGKDVCRSINNWSARKGRHVQGQTHDWWGRSNRKWHLMISELIARDPYFSSCLTDIERLENHTDMAAVEWIICMREGLHMTKKFNRNIFMVRYEDILDSPATAIDALLDFCELPGDEKMLSYAYKKLHAPTAYHDFSLSPAIGPFFNETMVSLGYVPDQP